MQPREHKLSQEVLEFLIAHQDWFMLDIAPPPATSTGTAGADGELDANLVFGLRRRMVESWKLRPKPPADKNREKEKHNR